ncbi:MAG: hypothetical protein AUJ32_02235 [Parcubacteria group bacterium CG1_02_40_82]|uniref:Homing endonuclease LAGLIDADG domain-containing protein n=4 Tax=Candidatus Portnoyibacteriota TaxID=1817913 RepID=A0A2M7IJA7_9BACT|nr:MAG: hypothetical protein AUJ32_02235 [Parcubacteria group bacterium CG1_02_40_82]PIQ75105.1 MAG: hypothetical protein COV84_03010 [Candidatus Portnoybacteria bacterium CG11_big_fil_rev_8_21_14_0_20_40_15]PIS31636.1 MAG: hypothetical protein COT41_01260 [Candidatus Portnoybacteria bacterium CG08_land_8_20_14_0_20_40_83]PIW76623.1 MAG: hypothetical protein CO001_00305 [Candidatus Portnoybacteria bacterium CG_4_8_14_3_um_filter_40_10]PIY74431.1 MAG: hypothetical protein COY85_03295 [Candidatus
MNAKSKVKIVWTKKFAYAIGLLTTDGSLSIDGRHINFTSKDRELILIFKKCLGLKNKIGKKSRAKDKEKKYFQIQFGDVNFYRFLLTIGLTPTKTKIISRIRIPEKYFFDFLRGHFDGDGTFYSYWDPRWHSSFMFYLVFISASKKHIDWLRLKIFKKLKIRGHINQSGKKNTYQLKYAKNEAKKLLPKIYSKNAPCLLRKYDKIKKVLKIEYNHSKQARVL